MGLGAIGQTRIMGGSIALAIATSVFHSYTRPRLQSLIGTPYLSPRHGPASGSVLSDEVRHVFAQGYNLQMLVLCGFAGAQVLAILLMWKKNQVLIG